jgi:hypothetical protein
MSEDELVFGRLSQEIICESSSCYVHVSSVVRI